MKLQFYRDGPDLNDVGAMIDIPDNNNSVLFIYKQKIADETGTGGTKIWNNGGVEIFWSFFENSLINCEIISF